MPGLLADVNVQGHLPYLRRLMEGLGLLEILTEMGLSLVTFPDLGLDGGIDDRTLWHYCQADNWVLFRRPAGLGVLVGWLSRAVRAAGRLWSAVLRGDYF